MEHFIINAALKGALEGFFEFMPVSSMGHGVLVDKLLPMAAGGADEVKKFNHFFDLGMQFPAILAIVVLYRRRLWAALRGIPAGGEERSFCLSIFVAFLPAVVVGLALKDRLEPLLAPRPVAIALLIGGVVLIAVERLAARGAIERAEAVPWRKALGIGLFQCFCFFPGASRSGSAIVGGRVLGLNRRAAAEFSFFLGVLTMSSAALFKLAKDYQDIDWRTQGALILMGAAAAFLTALAVVSIFMKLIEKRRALEFWGWYRIVLGAVVLYYA